MDLRAAAAAAANSHGLCFADNNDLLFGNLLIGLHLVGHITSVDVGRISGVDDLGDNNHDSVLLPGKLGVCTTSNDLTDHVAVLVLEMIFANVILVLLRLIDNDKLLLDQLGELHFLSLFNDCQLSLFELSDREDVVVIVVSILPRFDASWYPDQSSLSRKSRIPSCEISLGSRVKLWCCIMLVLMMLRMSVEDIPAAARVARPRVINVVKSMMMVVVWERGHKLVLIKTKVDV